MSTKSPMIGYWQAASKARRQKAQDALLESVLGPTVEQVRKGEAPFKPAPPPRKKPNRPPSVAGFGSYHPGRY